MTQEMGRCAEEIRTCWQEGEVALQRGDTDGANRAFGHAFEVVDTFPAIEDDDVRALQFLCVLTWVKVSASLEVTGQEEEAREARLQVTSLLDDMYAANPASAANPWPSSEFLHGLESEEAVDLVGRLYLLCSKAGRADSILWGRLFMDLDLRIHGDNPPTVN
ncbi:hypothetical protein [uncultured Paludibaculum sp.]|uniref:hypothetical protein n=1 Tax=uncultured Paludibaculum sp. TaxID=1765020 RepID=UPI002AAB6C14|nr:hypothetical protein [uncultured Paludibaculum sp.]